MLLVKDPTSSLSQACIEVSFFPRRALRECLKSGLLNGSESVVLQGEILPSQLPNSLSFKCLVKDDLSLAFCCRNKFLYDLPNSCTLVYTVVNWKVVPEAHWP